MATIFLQNRRRYHYYDMVHATDNIIISFAKVQQYELLCHSVNYYIYIIYRPYENWETGLKLILKKK
jgi:hypothetical protein